ncbi:uncharacterized protein C8A04DRAFT_27112 [Dichotomopilus funicola]|uniref:Uncharacterized protein n=1 Tax=Dichotomopilus funicola TaxID=1934379 RepID=A0AAN6V5E7_9PEZI|nr:hypothetical protein C8A04DRAFT_27112 [Dichotomopilus funicola]
MPVTTALKRAIVTKATNLGIAEMLKEQPIKGNPQAAAQQYLHFIVNLPWSNAWSCAVRGAHSKKSHNCRNPKRLSALDTILYELLISGADPTKLDEEGNTPLSQLANNLLYDSRPVLDIIHWLRPLSRGVDVNVRNQEGLSASGYLHSLRLASEDKEEIITAMDRVFGLKVGEGGDDNEILWRR